MTNDQDLTRLRERLVALTRDLVLIPGSEERPGELDRAIQWVGNHLESLDGVEVQWIESNRVRSLLALPAGCTNPEVVMFGHVDVVHHPDPDSYRSELRDGRIVGPGTGDMKGIVAVLLELFRSLHLGRPGLSLGLAITTDEERGGEDGTRALLEDHGLHPRLAIVPDGGTIDEIVVEEKGILQVYLESTGRSCHAARPWLGRNALELIVHTAGKIVDLVREIDPNPPDNGGWNTSCSVTRISTPNRSANRIPSHAGATLDIRFPHPITADELRTAIGEVLPPGVAVQRTVVARPTQLSPDPAFFDTCEAVLGRRPLERREHGGSDARFIARHGIPVIMSRPHCGDLHSRREWIEIDSMLQFYEIYHRYLEERLA